LYLEFYCIMGGSIVSWVFYGGFPLNLGFYCIMGSFFVSWVFDGVLLLYLGFYCIMRVTLYLGCLMRNFYCILGVCLGLLLYFGFHLGFGCCGYVVSCGLSYGLAELLLCILPVYFWAPYIFLMKFSYLSKKKKKDWKYSG
jgi:hypothetical protein